MIRPQAVGAAALGVLALVSIWSPPVPRAELSQSFGFQLALAWVAVLAAVAAAVTTSRLGTALAALSGLAVAAWLGWQSVHLLSPGLAGQDLRLLPIDLLGEGWYAALGVWALAVDGLVSRLPEAQRPGWLAVLPGMGLLRIGEAGRGRAWLAGVAAAILMVKFAAVDSLEFAAFQHYAELPPGRPRILAYVALGLPLLVWAASVVDTWRVSRLAARG
ncbi:MAG TPA: hypothetical protein VF134_04295 [Candidatus Dormibacteraeota bacterium]